MENTESQLSHSERDEKEFEEKARRRAREKGSFLGHFIIYIIVNFFLAIINLVTDRENLWFQWVLIGWGVGLFIHFISSFILDGIVARYVENQTKKELAKYKSKNK